MKIKTLTINYIRGIVQITFNFGGQNVVIYGMNGTGKSAVVDAIDFLLTGDISRLKGIGTAGISLSKHGKHITCDDPSKAYVSATITIPGVSNDVEICRYMSDPSTLVCDDKYKDQVEAIEKIAKRKQFLLTRKEILSFIIAEGSTRGEMIQKFLDLGKISSIRRELVQISNGSKRVVELHSDRTSVTKKRITTRLKETAYSEESVLIHVNERRKILGAPPLASLDHKHILVGLNPQFAGNPDNRKITQKQLLQSISYLSGICDKEKISNASTGIGLLIADLKSLSARRENIKIVKQAVFLKSGLNQLDHEESASCQCPFCLSDWDTEKLRKNVEERLQKVDELSKILERILLQKEESVGYLKNLGDATKILKDTLDEVTFPDERETLLRFETKVEEHRSLFKSEITELLQQQTSIDPNIFSEFVNQVKLPELMEKIKKVVPDSSTEQEAFSVLSEIKSSLEVLVDQEKSYDLSQKTQERAKALLDSFEESQSEAFNELYESIQDRFIDLYKALHKNNEPNFDAKLTQVGGSVNLSVDFFGKGMHPPHALHSDGHQDSMGICLFLALSEKVNEKIIGCIVLDDVVISVDTEHRKELCALLKKEFPNTQFIVTTHDTIWAHQLKSETFVSSSNMKKFFDWDVDSGPLQENESNMDVWKRIDECLKKDDVSSGAPILRKYCEKFFLDFCADWEVAIKCKLDSRWTLGDVFPQAWKKYKEILKKASASASSWGNTALAKELSDKVTDGELAFDSSWNKNSGSVNTATHYTHWDTMTKHDFEPVVEAFHEFINFFTCPSCSQLYTIAWDSNHEPNVFKCGCTIYNLELKPKT